MALIRLDKYLSDSLIGTRNQVRELIKKGRVSVNGNTVKKNDVKIDLNKDTVKLDSNEVFYIKNRYYMLNKPAGYVSATEDKNEVTVLELLKGINTKNLFPIGRLDKDTEGLLLLSDDGEMSHFLLSPKHHVQKIYYVRVKGIISSEDISELERGVDIGEKNITLPSKAELISSDKEKDESCILLSISEGKFHQVKRMIKAVNKTVIYLKRISFGGIELDPELEKGSFRELTEAEIQVLKGNMPAKNN